MKYQNIFHRDRVATSTMYSRTPSAARRRVLCFGIATLLLLLVGGVVLAAELTNDKPEPKSFEETIRLGGEWFINNENEEFLNYEFHPFLKKHSEEKQRLREMAGMWSIAMLGNYLQDDRLKLLAGKGMEFFDDSFKDDPAGGMFINIEPNAIKLAYNAFAILALLELDDAEKNTYLEPLKDGILSQQLPSGELDTFRFSDREGGEDFYPGEALFALMALYEKTGDQEILTAVEKAFPFYRDYWRANKTTAFVPWQTRAYRKLYAANGNEEVKDFVFEMNDWLLDQSARTPGKCSVFRFGGISTAVQMEGVVQAYSLAKAVDDVRRRECYAKFTRDGAKFIRSLQVTSEKPFGKPAYGGFFGKKVPSDPRSVAPDKLPTMRVDNNQHAVVALMEATEEGIIE